MNRFVIRADEGWLAFGEPAAVLQTSRPEQIRPLLSQIEQAVTEQGLTAAGFLAYEAAAALGLDCHPPVPGLPLLWFGLFRPEQIHQLPSLPPIDPAGYQLGDWQPSVSRADYQQAIAAIKAAIAAGQTYQVNYTMRLQTSFRGDPWQFFLDLHGAQQSHYAAYLDTGRYIFCSASPELFFRLQGQQLTAKPMKGTAGRGLTLAQDQAKRDWLRQSPKNQAENVMIVDMLRNDIGRIAAIGSVQVPALFAVEPYPTLWQMTSTVTGRTTAPFNQMLAALFPCASITGAPKVRTMQLIRQLESTPRGLYTGAIGYLAPGREAQFNVAIRTVTIDTLSGRAEYGVGGGIVWDSQTEEEYEECLLKAAILTQRRPAFELLETMRWSPAEGYFLLAEHLQRLNDSAQYFGFALNNDQLQAQLAALWPSLPPVAHKVRLRLAPAGQIGLEATPLAPWPASPIRLGLAARPVDSQNPFLYHKTTHRQMYEEAKRLRPGYDDLLLWNPAGFLTESTIANVLVRLNGQLLTPPVTAGLLPGTLRAHLLAQKAIHEQPIPLAQLSQAEQIFLINSVRGWQEAILAD